MTRIKDSLHTVKEGNDYRCSEVKLIAHKESMAAVPDKIGLRERSNGYEAE